MLLVHLLDDDRADVRLHGHNKRRTEGVSMESVGMEGVSLTDVGLQGHPEGTEGQTQQAEIIDFLYHSGERGLC